MRCLVELCVTELRSAVEAHEGGADRVELCADLASGGVTPSAGLIAEVVDRTNLPTHVLIRPRPGDFLVGFDELAVMQRDIDIARSLGASGVVLEALRPDGRVDLETTARLVKRARPLTVTFHKAIDLTPDPIQAIDDLLSVGIDRILTSGGLGPARDNLATLRAMVEHASGRLVVMAGGGITLADIPRILAETGVREIHLGSAVQGPPPSETPFGRAVGVVELAKVQRLMSLVDRESRA